MGCTVRRRRGKSGWLLTICWRKQRITKTYRTRRQAEAAAARIEPVLAEADLTGLSSGAELRQLLRDTSTLTTKKRAKIPTFGDYSTQWLADKKQWLDQGGESAWSPNTYAQREAFVRLHIKPRWEQTRLDDIDQPAVRRLLRELRAQKKSASFLRSALATISGLFRSAKLDYPDFIAANPALGAGVDIIPPNTKSARPQAWDEDQRTRLLVALADEPDRNVRDLLLFLDATGARIGEAMALVWQDLDIDQGQATIRKTYTKRKLGTAKTSTSARSIIVTEATIKRLRALRAYNDRQALATGSLASSVVFQGDGELAARG